MADVVTIIAVAGGVVGAVGGSGGLLALIQAWRQAKRETTQDIWGSFKDQIASAEARNDTAEVDRLRREYEGQLEAWRAQQGVVALAPKDVARSEGAPRLSADEIAQLKDLLARSVILDPSLLSATDYFFRGNAYYESGDYESALEAYNRSLETRPNDPDVLNNRGNALSKLTRHEEALADYNRSLELRPNDPTTLSNRGNALPHLGRHDEALADFNRSLQLTPDNPDTLNNRGIVLRNLGRYDEALADYNRSLQLRPDHPETLSNRGVALHYLDRHEEALPDHDRALEVRPDDPDSLSNRGVALQNLDRYDDAFADFSRALQLSPDHEDAQYNMACLFAVWGRLGESMEWLEKAIAANEKYRAMAREDKDFDNVRNDPEYGPRFRELVGEDEPPGEREGAERPRQE